MFFRRVIEAVPGFEERLDRLRAAGFAVSQHGSGAVCVSRGVCAADLKDAGGCAQVEGRAGISAGDGIAVLVDGGYQKFFRTPDGKKKPALADELKALHEFEADLSETLGLKSLYNEGLGTVSALYQYDRVKDRDRGVPKRVWE
jgi:hypothetical protein